MKLNQFFALIIAAFLFIGCNQQPIGSTLLSSANSSDTIEDTTSTTDDGELDIQPDNSAMVVNVDNSDKVEITGNCKDLDRKNNRILVEVFAGEDENVEPYISNSLSDFCQDVPDHAGLYPPFPPLTSLTNKCFWVTKGVGIVEDAGLPSEEKTFPQCHNGRFGFSVKLGKILETATAGVYSKYTIRFKLRTLEGILSDSTFSRVTVNRGLNTPVIDTITADQANFACNLNMSPARFNLGILHTLTRTYTDVNGTSGSQTLFSNKNSALTIQNDSVFTWKDDNNILTHTPPLNLGIIAGVKYNYTLETSMDPTYAYNYGVSPPTAKATSDIVICETAAPKIFLNGSTAGASCPMAMTGNINIGLTTEWGMSTATNWTGPNSDNNNPLSYTNVTASCNPAFMPTACTMSGLPVGVTHYFAVRETGFGQIGKWSNVVPCLPQ